MKNNGITVAIALASALMAGQTFAADGTVHFRGEVIDSTCEVTPDTADQTVNIGRVAKTTFSGIDSTASVKDFHIKLDKCPATYTQAAVRFDGTEDKDTIGKGYLSIGTTIQIMLLSPTVKRTWASKRSLYRRWLRLRRVQRTRIPSSPLNT